MANSDQSLNLRPTRIAAELGKMLESSPFGGALALGLWTRARGTVDVDVTIYASATDPDDCLELLRNGGVEFI